MDIRMTWQYTEEGILLRRIGEDDKTLSNQRLFNVFVLGKITSAGRTIIRRA